MSTSTSTFPSKVDWTTYGFDVQRTGHNPAETALGPQTVSGLTHLWSTNVGSVVVAAPVLATDVRTGSIRRDLLYVGTEHGGLYALDAGTGGVVWARDLGSVATTCEDSPDGIFGTTGTPVVDRSTGSIFAVGGDGQLYALDLANGTTRSGWPVPITSDPAHEHVYGALTLFGGAVYAETASYCDQTPYYGRVVKVDASVPTIVATWYVTSPGTGAGGGGIWGWGGASLDPATGGVYVATGNATVDPENFGYAERVVRLSSALGVEASHYPGLSGCDVDFGSTPVLYQVPECPAQLVVENKVGTLYVYDRDHIARGPAQTLDISGAVAEGRLIGVAAHDPGARMVYVSTPTDLVGTGYRHGLLGFRIADDCRLQLRWQQTQGINGAVTSSPTVANGVVYYGDGPGQELLAVSGNTGDVLWRSGTTIAGAIYAPPIVVNGGVYVADWSHMVHAFRLPTPGTRSAPRRLRGDALPTG